MGISKAAPGIKGSLCDKCAASCRSQGQPCSTAGQSETRSQEKVEIVFTLSNLVFGKLNADEELERAVILAIKEGVLVGLPGYAGEDVDMVLSSGSVIATVQVMP